MYFWNSYPFIRLSIALIAGILAHNSFLNDCSSPIVYAMILAAIASSAISWKVGFYSFRHVNGILLILLFFRIGSELTHRQYHQKTQSHYVNLNAVNLQGFSGQIISTINNRTNHDRYVLSLTNVLSQDSLINVHGIIHLYVRKDTSDMLLNYGDMLVVKGSFFEVSVPGNPSEFHYKQYLSRQNIYSHAFVRTSDIKVYDSDPPNLLFKYAYIFQGLALNIIDKNIPDARENGIAKALLLGIKDHLDNEVKRSYSAAGAMHVLAVSGLHVGVIYLFLQYLFGPLRATSTGRKVFGFLSILIIWAYATITGLSPSVLRAATMFSIMALSNMQARTGNIYNTLGVAAFILLLFDPHLIYSVGFQLSFAAVFGIVYLQPKLYRLFDFHFWIVDKAWAITCVSIAAQVATFPISAFYFHQFPTYFLISNLVVIPAATVMLLGGILMLIVDFVSSSLGFFIGKILSKFIWLINEAIGLVESLPNSLLDWIYMDQLGLTMSYAIILSLFWGIHHKSFNTLLISVILLIGFYMARLTKVEKQSQKELIILYEMSNELAIDHIAGHQSTLYATHIKDIELLSFQIDPYRLASGLRPIREHIQAIGQSRCFKKNSFYTAGALGGVKILIIDSSTFHLDFSQPIDTDLLVIENESVKSLAWLNSKFHYKYLILGNKNSTFFIRKIKKQAQQLNQKAHALKQDGAFSLTLTNYEKSSGNFERLNENGQSRLRRKDRILWD